jgi:hypothetical protein
VRSNKVVDEAIAALKGPGLPIAEAEEVAPRRPGLYAVHGDPQVWSELGLGKPSDKRPLYVGKSESSLADRDIRTHFSDGRTGQSTVRRSFAALLANRLGLHSQPRNPAKPERFANYGLSREHDAVLTKWMRRHLRLSFWVAEGTSVALAGLELAIIDYWEPPLNLRGITTQWTVALREARARMANEARVWSGHG